MSTITEIKVPEPLISVQSRVSWGALLAGSVVAIAIYSLLTMLGIAVGFSVSDRLDADQLGTGAAVWAFVTLLIGMFFGGWVATRCTAGELRTEAILYGIIVWGITSTLLIPLTAAGIGLGSGTALADRGVAYVKNSAIPPMLDGARFTSERIEERIRESRGGSEARGSDNSRSRNESRTSDDSRKSDEKSSGDSGERSRSDSGDGQSSTRGDRSDSATSDTDRSDRTTADRGPDRSGENRATGDRDSDRISQSTGSVREHLKAASWWTFGGTLGSMLAAIFGALLGPHVVITHRKYVNPRPLA